MMSVANNVLVGINKLGNRDYKVGKRLPIFIKIEQLLV